MEDEIIDVKAKVIFGNEEHGTILLLAHPGTGSWNVYEFREDGWEVATDEDGEKYLKFAGLEQSPN